jgi:trehalose 6-phosphate synthase/phosphatase
VHRPGDLIWVHDYQLMLVPEMVRRRIPDARIGFFLHIPFPASEVFRTLPNREQVLRGLLGADLIGFHTASYLRHFGNSVMRILGATPEIDRVTWDSRLVRLGVFPMGIDARNFEESAESPAVKAEVASLRREPEVKQLLAIDRLDYTKGITRRLLAYDLLLSRHPELRGRVRLVQVAVPSRTGVEAYQEFRETVDALIGRLQGDYGTPTWMPVHYVYRNLSPSEVVALYCACDVMVVTPVRDGMNLVAKEFVASRVDGDGVLVLSELAGAGAELAEAIIVNPYDVDAIADSLYRALTMERDERRGRMDVLRRRVRRWDVHRWRESFLSRLAAADSLPPVDLTGGPPPLKPLLQATTRALLLDYDGTLVPIAPTPMEAAPDTALCSLLRALAARRDTEVHIVSGRPRETLERWLGHLPIALHGEHGLWSREVGGEWELTPLGDLSWRDPVREILDDFTARTPGAILEEKTASFAWHYRRADPEFGAFQANELRIHLLQLLSAAPVDVLDGHKLIEVRPMGITKARVIAPLLARGAPAILAMGDDQTDEDLFAELPEDAISVRVGRGPSRARFRLGGPSEVRHFLEQLRDAP